MLDNAKLPRERVYELRHWFASLLLTEGVPISVVSEAMGHSGTQVTKDTYGHIPLEAQRDAANLLARLFGGEDGTDEETWAKLGQRPNRADWRSRKTGDSTGVETRRARRDSNPRPLVPKTSALSTELRARMTLTGRQRVNGLGQMLAPGRWRP